MPKLIAILGSTASGKTDLALELATKHNLDIFNIDSLSIYKDINIFAAKPQNTGSVRHFGLNILKIHEKCNAMLFHELLLKAIQVCDKKALLITGGTSFYLKSIMQGLSPKPAVLCTANNTEHHIKAQIKTLKSPFEFLKSIDPTIKINKNDEFRIKKALEIFFATNLPPSEYFKQNPPQIFPHHIELFCIQTQKEELRKAISLRTKNMLKNGALDEIKQILNRLNPILSAKEITSNYQSLRAVGVKEAVEFLKNEELQDLDNSTILNISNKKASAHTLKSYKDLEQRIINSTNKLAKRQKTFNKTQFKNILHAPKNELKNAIEQSLA